MNKIEAKTQCPLKLRNKTEGWEARWEAAREAHLQSGDAADPGDGSKDPKCGAESGQDHRGIHIGAKEGNREFYSSINHQHLFIIITLPIYLQTHQVIYIKYLPFEYLLYFNKLI